MQLVILKLDETGKFFECKVTPQTKVSSLRSVIYSNFGIEPSDQILLYSNQTSDLISSDFSEITDEDSITEIVPPNGIIHVQRKGTEVLWHKK